ncbi:MAG: hypothetical protein ACQEXJ_17055 [Myxococcota bacterium]
MSAMSVLILALVAVGVVLWWKRRHRAVGSVALTPELVGCTGTVASDRLEVDGEGRVRVVDSRGRPREIAARLVDADDAMARGQEILVIQDPRPERPALVVPTDLPGLEDLS